MEAKCFYCGKKADGAMLTMGDQMAHAFCVIKKLNGLFDFNYEGVGEPEQIVGLTGISFQAGYRQALKELKEIGMECELSGKGIAMLPPYWYLIAPPEFVARLGITGHGFLVFIPEGGEGCQM